MRGVAGSAEAQRGAVGRSVIIPETVVAKSMPADGATSLERVEPFEDLAVADVMKTIADRTEAISNGVGGCSKGSKWRRFENPTSFLQCS